MEAAPTSSAAEAGEADWTSSQVARAFGVSVRTLRSYEDHGLLVPRERGRYGAADRDRLRLILEGKRLGLSLVDIHGLVEGQSGAGSVRAVGPDLDRVYRRAKETFGTEEKAERWLGRPTTALAGLSPLAVSSGSSEGVEKVLGLLTRIDHGLAV